MEVCDPGNRGGCDLGKEHEPEGSYCQVMTSQTSGGHAVTPSGL